MEATLKIDYSVNTSVSVEEFISVLNGSGLGSRRPMEDPECLRGMLENSNLLICARRNGILVGLAALAKEKGWEVINGK